MLALMVSVFGGEVDCTSELRGDATQEQLAKGYIELKTNYEFKHRGQEINFKRYGFRCIFGVILS